MSWKTFRFFDYEEVKDPETDEPFGRLKDLGITCCSCGRGMMVFGDASGCLHILYRLSEMFSFKAYAQRIQHLYQLKTRSIVITVGDDEDFSPLIRVWNLEKRDKAGNPSLARTIKAVVREGKVQHSGVMAITAHENMNLIAVGYKDGTVQLLKGNITRDRASRQRIIHKETEAGVYVTGLAFRQQASNPVLMVSTTTAVYSFIITDNPKPIQVGMMGCELNCSTMTDHSQDHKFVICRQELVQFFTTESPAQCFGFEGEKSLLRWYRGYLITASIGGRGGVTRMPSGSTPESRTLTVYDIQNQLVAYQTSFPTRIVDVLSEWGSLYVLLKDGRFFRLEELDTKSKLETLFKKNLYHIAISLAKSQSYSDGLVEIFKEYGDHLYSKGDYDGAIDQYKLTIGSLEPSYVIRRFLDAQRIHNLTDYLKVLHEKSQANADHTTLLLNCYTKLKNEQQLDEFVKEEQAVFDVEAAIKVCRQATFFEHALTLAQRFSQHDWFLLILLEDLHRHQQALDYIRSLKLSAAVQSMTKYGRTLVKVLPWETTNLLIALCTDWLVDQNPSLATDIVAPDGPPLVIPSSSDLVRYGNPSKFIPIFVDKKENLTHFLEEMIRLRDCWSEHVCNSLLELYLTPCDGKIQEEKALSLLKNTNAKYEVEHALMLARTCDFKIGILYLYEKAGRYQQILDYHIEHKDVELVMDTCRRFNHQDPSLWVQALSFYASREDCRDKIPQVLQHIEEQHLLQPLMVVKLLAENKCATLSDIKPYIVRHLEEQNEAINKDEKLIKEYREGTAIMREQISELQSKAKVFQVMKCSQCKRGLTLPAVHFLCQHSFHQNCMEDDYENECPICARENRKVLENIQRQEQSTGLHEQFDSQLQRSPDGFSVVAEYFGRGVFGKISKEQTRTA